MAKVKPNKMMPTIKELAQYLSMTPRGLYKMRKERPKLFELVMIGFIEKIKKEKQ